MVLNPLAHFIQRVRGTQTRQRVVDRTLRDRHGDGHRSKWDGLAILTLRAIAWSSRGNRSLIAGVCGRRRVMPSHRLMMSPHALRMEIVAAGGESVVGTQQHRQHKAHRTNGPAYCWSQASLSCCEGCRHEDVLFENPNEARRTLELTLVAIQSTFTPPRDCGEQRGDCSSEVAD